MPKSSIRVLVAAFALAVAGAGCVASLGEMRAKPAQRVLVAPGRYGDLGGCVAAGLQEAPTAGFWGFLLKPGDLRLEVVRRDDQQTMTVTGFPVAMDMAALSDEKEARPMKKMEKSSSARMEAKPSPMPPPKLASQISPLRGSAIASIHG